MRIDRFIRKGLKLLDKLLLRPAQIGFISPQVDLSKDEQKVARSLIGSDDYIYVPQFEREFAGHIGTGSCIAFAAGRMAFYAILKSLNIGKGDEVVLTGYTCSVMVNAVLRIGATPIFVDIDKDTLGTSPVDLQRKLTNKTKVIVAQNTFGIPCEIDKIKEIAKNNNCFLVEDCALTLGTKYNGVTMGDWGDASIFSIDHTKPLNAMIGGLVYTKDVHLEKKLRVINSQAGELTTEHQALVLKRYIAEQSMEKKGHAFFTRNGYWITIKRKLGIEVKMPYLECDSGACIDENAFYPYPAKMPELVAYLGLKVLHHYYQNIGERKQIQNEIITIIKDKEPMPSMLFNNNAEIILLRVPFLLTVKSIKDYGFIDDWIWFKAPIIATPYPISTLGYKSGSCPISEETGKIIMNLPVVFEDKLREQMIRKIEKVYQ